MSRWVPNNNLNLYVRTYNLEFLQEEGVTLKLNGHEQTIYGTLTIATADNLASQQLGGYKGLASAHRKCRFCMAVMSDMVSKVCSSFRIRIGCFFFELYNAVHHVYLQHVHVEGQTCAWSFYLMHTMYIVHWL